MIPSYYFLNLITVYFILYARTQGSFVLLCTVLLAQAKLKLIGAQESIGMHFIRCQFYTTAAFWLLDFLVICLVTIVV